MGGRQVSAERWAEIALEARLGRTRAAGQWAALEVLPVIEGIRAAGAQSLRRLPRRSMVEASAPPVAGAGVPHKWRGHSLMQTGSLATRNGALREPTKRSQQNSARNKIRKFWRRVESVCLLAFDA